MEKTMLEIDVQDMEDYTDGKNIATFIIVVGLVTFSG
jgi:hypothetical protein